MAVRFGPRAQKLTRPKLLIIDAVGYLTLEKTHASLLFQAICERYEKRQPIILTSNKAFADWAQVFADNNIMASSALDRLLSPLARTAYPRPNPMRKRGDPKGMVRRPR